jgi:hypothetical protein
MYCIRLLPPHEQGEPSDQQTTKHHLKQLGWGQLNEAEKRESALNVTALVI